MRTRQLDHLREFRLVVKFVASSTSIGVVKPSSTRRRPAHRARLHHKADSIVILGLRDGGSSTISTTIMIAQVLGQLGYIRTDSNYPCECTVCTDPMTRRIETQKFIDNMLRAIFKLCTVYSYDGLQFPCTMVCVTSISLGPSR